MISEFFPSDTACSVFTINYWKLYKAGYRGLLFDIDNTLVRHQADSTPDINELFKQLHEMGFRILVLSNNDKTRVLRFLKDIDSLYIYDAGKPDPGSYYKACSMLHLKTGQVIMIGDQLFTDIRGANRAGITSILVDFIRSPNEKWIGWHRYAEYAILFVYSIKKYCTSGEKGKSKLGKLLHGEMLFCEISPAAYRISQKKEILKRKVKDCFSKDQFAKRRSKEYLPYSAANEDTELIKKAPGVDQTLQKNKVVNIDLASREINHLMVYPGEVFSFWRIVGPPTERKGYRKGRIIKDGKLIPGIGGGLCNLANTLLLLLLNSPLTITELHTHSDALSPDEGPRRPFSSGTSVSYNNIDLRFRNDTDQVFQLIVWCEGHTLHAQLRCEYEFPYLYRLSEEDHHFSRERGKYYRISKIYHETYDRKTGKLLRRKLLRDNHSEVMFDPALIPMEMIRK